MLGALLGAVGSIAGGLLGNKAADKANKQQAQQAAQNRKDQYDFAQNSLQWKAADAEKAGISKVFAMGAPSSSFSPVSVGSTSADYGFLDRAGQNIGRAMEAGQSNTQTAASRTAQGIQLEGMSLDNDIKRAQLSSILRTQSQPGTPPGIPAPNTLSFLPGQGDSAQGEVNVSTKIDTASKLDPATTPGYTPEAMFTTTNSGGHAPALPPALQEAYESMGIVPTLQWTGRNLVRPAFNEDYRPKEMLDYARKTNQNLVFDPIFGEYRFKPKNSYHNPRSR